jgi:hypothetical protein
VLHELRDTTGVDVTGILSSGRQQTKEPGVIADEVK